MSTQSATYDPAWEQLFGEFQLIPSLKPRPGDMRTQTRRSGRSASRARAGSSAVGMISNALLTHQAVVKIVRGGGVTSAGRLAGQLAYISRHGTLTTERGETGERIEGMDGFKAVKKDWARDWQGMDARTTNYTYHVIVSYPKETDPYAAEVAAESFAHRLTGGEYGGRYKFVMAHHRDTDFPHTHLIINRAAQDGKTLHLSRYGVTVDDLRDLHVETARDVGIVLNATSRFSRNLAPEYESSARIHARREGRRLAETPVQEARSGFPYHGRGRQTPVAPDVIQTLKDQRNTEYAALGETLRSHQAGVMQGIFSNQTPGRAETLGTFGTAVLGAAKTLLRDGALNKEEIDVNQHITDGLNPAMASGVEAELKDIGSDIRGFIKGMSDKADAMEDEDKRSQTEAAISRVLRDYEPLMDEETRKHFGKRLERDDEIDVGRNDTDPFRQRRAAERDAADPTRALPLEQDRAIPDDPRGLATRAALSTADGQVSDRFEAMGLNGDLIMSRIRNGSDVDRETREKWFERDVQTLANAHSLSEKQARADMTAAYKDAAEIYRDARGEIRDINRAFAEGRGDEYLSDKVSQGMQAEFKRLKSLGYDNAGLGGQLGEIEARVSDRVLGYVPDRLKDAVSPFERLQSEERGPNATPRSQTDQAHRSSRIDLVEGVRGEIVVTGSALYDKEDKDSLSPYVDLKMQGRDKPYRVWGVDLPDMMQRQNLAVGDTATLAHNGFKTVSVKKTDRETGEEKTVEAKRRAWKASDIERGPREEERSQERGQDLATAPRGSAHEQAKKGENERAVREEVSVQTGVTGVIVDAKEALARPSDPESQSFYVDVKRDGQDAPKRLWGTALQDQMERNNLSIGDKATFKEAGKEVVTRDRRNSETDEFEKVNVTRKAWDVTNIDRRIDRDPDIQDRRQRERQDRAKGDRDISR